MIEKIIIAHRGESYLAPENTLSAINLAWEKGADAIEVDIRLTKDKQIVVIHDADTKRISGKYRKIKDTTLVNLKKLDVGRYKNEKYEGEKIPTLQEVLNTVPSGKKILIEIKSSSKIIPYLKEIIHNSDLKTDQIEIISFHLKTLIEVKKQLSQFSVLWILALSNKGIRKLFQPSINSVIKKATKYKLQGLDLWAGGLINIEIIEKIKLAGLKLYTWTVDNSDTARNFFDMGVDGITTNRAKWMKNQLRLKN